MRRLVGGVLTIDKLGRCLFCMRAAFALATASWLLTLAILTGLGASVAVPAAAVATSLSVLWLAHLAAHATRSARCRLATATVEADGRVTRYSRRNALAFFAQALAAVAVASMLPTATVRAQSGCPSTHPYPCGTQHCCSAQALYYCEGYTGHVENWRKAGTFCTRENSDEDVADLRSNCAVFVTC